MIELFVGILILVILNKTHPKIGNDIIIPLPDWNTNNQHINNDHMEKGDSDGCDGCDN